MNKKSRREKMFDRHLVENKTDDTQAKLLPHVQGGRFDTAYNLILHSNLSRTITFTSALTRSRSDRVLSIDTWINKLYKNRAHRSVASLDKITTVSGGEVSRWLAFKPKKKFMFFPDKYTLCIIEGIQCYTSIAYPENIRIEPRISFIGLHADDYYMTAINIAKRLSRIRKNKCGNLTDKVGVCSMITIDFNEMHKPTVNTELGVRLKTYDDVIAPDSIKLLLQMKVRAFIESANIYNQYEINRTIGFLLHGVPGTGKTSMIKAICDQFMKEIYRAKGNTDFVQYAKLDVSIDVSSLRCAISDIIKETITEPADNGVDVTQRYVIIIMEELDSVLNVSRDTVEDDSNSKVKLLMELLDGMNTPAGNFVFLASTNYYEKLDSALIRPGRFSVQIEMGNFSLDEIEKMCEHFSVPIDSIFVGTRYEHSYTANKFTINPAELQNIILNYIIQKKLNEEGLTE